MIDVLERARTYLANNAAESGADELILELCAEVESLRKQWSEMACRILTQAQQTNEMVRDANARIDKIETVRR